MKRTSLIALFLAFVMLLCPVLASCGGGTPEETKAEDTKPAETEPAETKPAETEPATEPAATEPEQTEPAETEPEETEPEETEPGETEPALITVDVSALKFDNATISYDGDEHTLLVEGLDTLPDGVTVAYKNNKGKRIGEYKAKATFTVPDGYAPIAAMEATLTIKADLSEDGTFRYVNAEKTFLYDISASFTGAAAAIPDGVTKIAEYAVYGQKNLKALLVPASVTEISDYAFGFKSRYGEPVVDKDFVVYGTEGSAAEAFCEKNGITFKTEDPVIHVASVTDLYVTDGLVLLLDAFDPSNSTVDLANGKWYSKLDNSKYATFHAGTDIPWVTRDHGVGYNLTQAQYDGKGAKRSCYLDLGESIVNPIGNFTIEFVGAMYAIYDGTSFGSCTDSNYDTGASTNRYGAWAEWIFNMEKPTDCVRTSYVHNNGYTDHYGHNEYLTTNFTAYADRKIKCFSHVITGDDKTTAFTTFADGGEVRNQTVTFGSSINHENQPIVIADPEESKAFFIMRGTACTLMTVRVYDRALTKSEVQRNHFVDLCTYFGLDVSALDGIFSAELEAVTAKFAGFGFEADKDALQNLFNATMGITD